jgi:indolepyruvate ferredoxin oxidoreductase beta subunit
MSLIHDPANVIISGVGGQGNILASDLLARTCCEAGYFVSVGETYGATQRGGSVVSHVRLSHRHLYGPLIPRREAHMIIGFEPLEVLRNLLDYGHPSVRVVMNDRPFYPLDTLRRKSPYPDRDNLTAHIIRLSEELRIIKGTELAKQAGHPQALNVVMIGAFAGLNWVRLAKEQFLKALEAVFSDNKLEINRKAFSLGYEAVRGGRSSSSEIG